MIYILNLILAVGILYTNTINAPFVFDDLRAILYNPYLQDWDPFWNGLIPEGGNMFRRPVGHFTFALNYLAGGSRVQGYHLVNMIIHACSSLALFGVIRLSLLLPRFKERYRDKAVYLAFFAAFIWTVHPLLTQAVSYTVQRVECLMALFYLLTLYSMIQVSQNRHVRLWSLLAVLFCALGMGSKQVMVTAPILILIYDRVFLSSTWSEAFKLRGKLYGALFATWLLTFWIESRAIGPWRASAGFDFKDFTAWEYAITQPGVILHYLKLAFWPHPLVFDYHWPVAPDLQTAIPGWMGLTVLLIWIGVQFKKNPPVGFCGLWFLVILLPTSSILPIADLAAEHRMYLPLAGLMAVFVIGGYEWLQKVGNRLQWPERKRAWVCLAVAASVMLSFGLMTIQRNAIYEDPETLWRDTLAKRPMNYRAYYNLGLVMESKEAYDDALKNYLESVRINPRFEDGYNNVGIVHFKEGRYKEAEEYYRRAIQLKPAFPKAINNLGRLYVETEQYEEALKLYHQALLFMPRLKVTYTNLSLLMESLGKTELIEPYRMMSVRSQDYDLDESSLYNNIGALLAMQGRVDQAAVFFRKSLELDPRNVNAKKNLMEADNVMKSEQKN